VSGGFRIARRTSRLTSRVFRVETLEIEAPDGTTFARDVAVHPGAVAVLAVNDHGEVGLIHQYRATVDRLCWEVPAGTLDHAGETPLDAAKRELIEEIGCAASEWRELGRFMNSPGWTDQVMTIYEARGLSPRPRDPDGPEERLAELGWFDRTALEALAASEGALDAMTAISLQWIFGDFFRGR
jgi:8-oxo-dGDP phosphatase